MITPILPKLSHDALRGLWDALQQYVDNASDEIEDDRKQPAAWHAAKELLLEVDAYMERAACESPR